MLLDAGDRYVDICGQTLMSMRQTRENKSQVDTYVAAYEAHAKSNKVNISNLCKHEMVWELMGEEA